MTTYRVDIIEHERGWGQRADGYEYFSGKNALEKAKAFQKKYNSRNTAKEVPDTYWVARDPHLVPDEEAEAARKKRKRS